MYAIRSYYVEKITQRFYTVDEARTRSESGLGLGLSIVMEIVELHGWELLIESERNNFV